MSAADPVSVPIEIIPLEKMPRVGDFYTLSSGSPVNAFRMKDLVVETRPFPGLQEEMFSTTDFRTTLNYLDIAASIQISVAGGQFGLSAFVKVHKDSLDKTQSLHIVRRCRMNKQRVSLDYTSVIPHVRAPDAMFGWEHAKKLGATHIVVQAIIGSYITMDLSLSDNNTADIFALSAGGSGTASYSGITGTLRASIKLVQSAGKRDLNLGVHTMSSDNVPYSPEGALQGDALYQDAMKFWNAATTRLAKGESPSTVLSFSLIPMAAFEQLSAAIDRPINQGEEVNRTRCLGLLTILATTASELTTLIMYSQLNGMQRWRAEVEYYQDIVAMRQRELNRQIAIAGKQADELERNPKATFNPRVTYQDVLKEFDARVKSLDRLVMAENTASLHVRTHVALRRLIELNSKYRVQLTSSIELTASLPMVLRPVVVAETSLWDGASHPTLFTVLPDGTWKTMSLDGQAPSTAGGGGGVAAVTAVSNRSSVSDISRAIQAVVSVSESRADKIFGPKSVVPFLVDTLADLSGSQAKEITPADLPGGSSSHWRLGGMAVDDELKKQFGITGGLDAIQEVPVKWYLRGIRVVYVPHGQPPPPRRLFINGVSSADADTMAGSISAFFRQRKSATSALLQPKKDEEVYLVPLWTCFPDNAVVGLRVLDEDGIDVTDRKSLKKFYDKQQSKKTTGLKPPPDPSLPLDPEPPGPTKYDVASLSRLDPCSETDADPQMSSGGATVDSDGFVRYLAPEFTMGDTENRIVDVQLFTSSSLVEGFDACLRIDDRDGPKSSSDVLNKLPPLLLCYRLENVLSSGTFVLEEGFYRLFSPSKPGYFLGLEAGSGGEIDGAVVSLVKRTDTLAAKLAAEAAAKQKGRNPEAPYSSDDDAADTHLIANQRSVDITAIWEVRRVGYDLYTIVSCAKHSLEYCWTLSPEDDKLRLAQRHGITTQQFQLTPLGSKDSKFYAFGFSCLPTEQQLADAAIVQGLTTAEIAASLRPPLVLNNYLAKGNAGDEMSAIGFLPI